MLKINEIFYSIQGESRYAGFPCVFIRLSQCNLECSYCDTKYANEVNFEYSCEDIINKINSYDCNLVEITGGEPLLQNEVYDLIKILYDKDKTVLLETNGSVLIDKVDERVNIIMDIKCLSRDLGSSGHETDFCEENLNYIKKTDQIKFVIGGQEDYLWAKKYFKENKLEQKAQIIFSPVYKKFSAGLLAQNILEDNLNVRLQVQLHKVIGLM